jgi:hypothetical protein
MTNKHRAETVILSAWVDPALRDHARLEAKAAGIPFSTFIERAIQQAVAKASSARALQDAEARERLERAGQPLTGP